MEPLKWTPGPLAEIPWRDSDHHLALQALETVHRVNVGGGQLTPANDTLWRSWSPDDEFLYLKSSLTASKNPQSIKYDDAVTMQEIAPPLVYSTVRTMNISAGDLKSNPLFNYNFTWVFWIIPGYKYLIRMHFCDIVSTSFTSVVGQGLEFNVYIQEFFAKQDLNPQTYTSFLDEPFHLDFILDAQSYSYINVSISRSTQSSSTNATLNGLEIMRLNNSFASLDGTFNPNTGQVDSSKKGVSVPVVIGSVLGDTFASPLRPPRSTSEVPRLN